MADMIDLCLRHAPWSPSPQSELIAEYRYYDAPLMGVVRQGDRDFLFTCMAGEDDVASLWWYTAIDAEQQAALRAAETTDAFNDLLHDMEFHGWSRLALATEKLGIVDYEDADESPEGLATALRAIQSRLHELSVEAGNLALVP